MSTRRWKQVLYGIFYLVILYGIGAGIYYGFVHQPVVPCVDCVAASSTQPLVVADLRTFISSPGHLTFLARVQNHNSDYAAARFNYSFELQDASGTILQSVPGDSFIYAAEVKYIVATNVPVAPGASLFSRAVLNIKNTDWAPASKLGLVPQFGNPLTIVGDSVSQSVASVKGQITNSDVSSFAPVRIVAIFYGQSGLPIGASETQIDEIAPNQTLPFTVSYPVTPGLDPTLTKAYAYALRP